MIYDYSGVKFFSETDLSCGYHLQTAVEILENFNPEKEYTEINEVIELYNIKKYFDSGVTLTAWDEATIQKYKDICKKFSKPIGIFFSNINSSNINAFFNSLDFQYVEDFWEIFASNKVFNNITPQYFAMFLQEIKPILHYMLNQKELVVFYNKELTEYIKEEPANAEIIIDYFLAAHEKERKKVYFPTDFTWKEQEKLIYQYIESDSVNPNYLGLLENSQSSSEFPITDKMRLEAKRRNVEYCNKLFSDNSGIFYETEVIFKKIDEPEMDCELEGRTSRFVYSRNWIKNNLDYNTLLNNFIHLFGYTDLSMRCSFVSIPSKLGIFERSLGIKGKKYYPIGTFFNIRNIQTSLQMRGYINELKENGIQLEDVFKWFFETYLDEEFGIKDFRYNTPSPNTTSLEKCKLIASEIDGVLKQYNLYCEDGKIDRELFEMSSKHVVFSDVKSLNDKKYAYSNSKELEAEQHYLFSDQSTLYYTPKTECKYQSFAEVLLNEEMTFDDYADYQKRSLEWLIERKTIFKSDDGILSLNLKKYRILKDLFDKGVVCINYLNFLNDTISDLHEAGDLEFSSTLFSKPEQDYLNFVLNKSEFSNGYDLRNKYLHNTHSLETTIHERDCIELLKIMVLVIIKINEEFCLKYATKFNLK